MHIVVAPDSFKESLSAVSAARAMEEGIRSVFPEARVTKVPMADGGEGTVEALVSASGGETLGRDVTGPLGDHVRAHWGILGDGRTAVIEMAAASGLTLVPEDQRDPRRTTTRGTGELILAALDRGLRRLIVGIGGSATNDGGAGMAEALGARFLDSEGKDLPPGGGALSRLAAIDLTGLDPRIQETEILVACDVDNPLFGPRGASFTYGPQKGATPEMVEELDRALARYALVAARATGRDVADVPGAGAAGGLGAGFLFFTPARFRPGAEVVLDAVDFARLVEGADLVITGEGRTDFQTAHGKAPVGVARIARRFGIPVICLSGGLGEDADLALAHGIDALMSITPGPLSLEACLQSAQPLLEAATARTCRLLRIGMGLASASPR